MCKLLIKKGMINHFMKNYSKWSSVHTTSNCYFIQIKNNLRYSFIFTTKITIKFTKHYYIDTELKFIQFEKLKRLLFARNL